MSKKRNRTNSLYNIALNHNMQKCAYLMPQYSELTQETFSQKFASRFPGLTKDRLQEILRDYKMKGLNNNFSIHALQIYCDLLGQSPVDALSEHGLFPTNSVSFELFTWNDIKLLDSALVQKAEEFFDYNRELLPIQIPIKYSPKDMVLMYLELYENPSARLGLDFRISCYASSWGSHPSLDYVLETKDKASQAPGLLPGQKELKKHYDAACADFEKKCKASASLDSFGRVNDIVYEIFEEDISLLEGSISAFFPAEYFDEDEKETPPQKQMLEQKISRNDDHR